MKTLFQLSEAVEKHHVTAFIRGNPPTTGHMQLIDKIHSVAKENSADHSVVVSHSQDPKKNPLSSDQKKKHFKRFSPETNVVASSKEHPTILHHLAALHKAGVTHLHLVAGSDRHAEFEKLVNSYNGKKAGHGYYKFKKITIHSAGERDPDAEGTSGISATKQREHAASGNFEEFRKGVPAHVSDAHAKDLMNDVKNGQKTKKNEESEMESLDNLFEQFMIEDSQSFSDEEIWNVVSGMHSHELDPNENDVEFIDILMGESYEEDIDESRVLSIAQRQRARMKFKSRQPRLKRMREIKRKRMATPQRLQYRARTSALMMLRKRIAGAKGLAYHTLSPSQRYSIDKAVQQRFGKNLDKLVGTISKRTLPMIRKKEMARLAKARGQKTSSIIGPQVITQSYDMSEEPDYISTNKDHLLTPKVNMLLRLGLVDQDEIERYRRALKIGEKALSSPELRSKILSMLDKTLKLATDDPQTFARIRAMVVLRKNSQNEQNSLEVDPLEIDPLEIDKMDLTPDQGHSQHLNLRKKMIRQHEAVNPAAAAAARRAAMIAKFKQKQQQQQQQFNARLAGVKPQNLFSSVRSTKTSGRSVLGTAAFGGDAMVVAKAGELAYRGAKAVVKAAAPVVRKGYDWLKKKLTAEYDPLAEDKIVESLYKKSMKYNISIDTIVEVYNNALKDSGNENIAFDTVNSFLANQELDEVQRRADRNRVKVRLPDGRIVWRNDRRATGVQREKDTEHMDEGAFSSGKLKPTEKFKKEAEKIPSTGTYMGRDNKGTYTAKLVNHIEVSRTYDTKEEVDADSIFEIEMYVPEIHEARGDHVIEGGTGKGRYHLHKDTSPNDHLDAMKYHLEEYHKAKKSKLKATQDYHAEMYHKHKKRIKKMGGVGNHLRESARDRLLGKIKQIAVAKAVRERINADALARHNAEQQKKGISKDAETKFHTKLDSLVHDTFGKRKSEKSVAEGYWADAVKKAEADREARKGKPFEKNPASHDKDGVYIGDKDLAGNPVSKRKEPGVAEATGDKPFDNIMTTIKQGTNKQKTEDRKEKQKQTQERARYAFGVNPADKLSIRKGVSEEGGAGEFGTSELTKKYAKDTPGQCQEILNMNTADMGDVIKDFKDSDAPQFNGKSKDKRREMAIAAKLNLQNKG